MAQFEVFFYWFILTGIIYRNDYYAALWHVTGSKMITLPEVRALIEI